MKYVAGKKMSIEKVDLDEVHHKLVQTLEKNFPHQELNLNEIVEEWINDLLYLAGHAELDEIMPLEE